jgi:hypothetical protein
MSLLLLGEAGPEAGGEAGSRAPRAAVFSAVDCRQLVDLRFPPLQEVRNSSFVFSVTEFDEILSTGTRSKVRSGLFWFFCFFLTIGIFLSSLVFDS